MSETCAPAILSILFAHVRWCSLMFADVRPSSLAYRGSLDVSWLRWDLAASKYAARARDNTRWWSHNLDYIIISCECILIFNCLSIGSLTHSLTHSMQHYHNYNYHVNYSLDGSRKWRQCRQCVELAVATLRHSPVPIALGRETRDEQREENVSSLVMMVTMVTSTMMMIALIALITMIMIIMIIMWCVCDSVLRAQPIGCTYSPTVSLNEFGNFANDCELCFVQAFDGIHWLAKRMAKNGDDEDGDKDATNNPNDD